MWWLRSCPRCGGDLHSWDGMSPQEAACLQCGRTVKLVPGVAPSLLRPEVDNAPPAREKSAEKQLEAVGAGR